MLDFLKIEPVRTKSGGCEITPTFKVKKSSDLMIKGSDFYAIWFEEKGMWSTDEDDAIFLIDQEVDSAAQEFQKTHPDASVRRMYLSDANNGLIDKWHKYCQKQMRDNFKPLDMHLIFADQKTTKKDYASRRLNYNLDEGGALDGYNSLMDVLYTPDERQKIEWAIGAVVAGEQGDVQKFLVLYGAPGTGKGTVIKIISMLFQDYANSFSAKALGSSTAAFSLEQFKSNPIVAYDPDGNLSRIDDNTKLNSIVSHETIVVNEKFRSQYTTSFNTMLFICSNSAVKITDAKSGLIRRLIDVTPTGNTLSKHDYNKNLKLIKFELGAIASHCRKVYLENRDCYDHYTPMFMIGATNYFYNFIEDYHDELTENDGISLNSAWELYKVFCEEAKVQYASTKLQFREELKNYFYEYYSSFTLPDGSIVRSYFKGFKDHFGTEEVTTKGEKKKAADVSNTSAEEDWLDLINQPSIFDKEFANSPAQYAVTRDGKEDIPSIAWKKVTTKLSDIDTSKVHYVRVPILMIVIDFDLKDENGNKSFERNKKAASEWPKTYAELSKGGQGIHLHYIYSGDPTELDSQYADDIEVKVFKGGATLRRRLSKCNHLPIATINSGLPKREVKKKVVNQAQIRSEKSLRNFLNRIMETRKLDKSDPRYVEGCEHTRPAVYFIDKVLKEYYDSGAKYDVSDMRTPIATFASSSTHNAVECLRVVNSMKFRSEEELDFEKTEDDESNWPIVFFDTEIFDEDPDDPTNPGLFLFNFKKRGEGNKIIRLVNPSANVMDKLFVRNEYHFRWVGFNCRGYDNHICYARAMGATQHQLYLRSVGIINSKTKKDKAKYYYGAAYNLSYTDIWDFASNKQGLKKWEIELGIHHQELGWPWDKPLPKDMWQKASEYCDNDVLATEAVFEHLIGEYDARCILVALVKAIHPDVDACPNDTNNQLSKKAVFGSDPHPQNKLVYRNLGEKTDPTMWCYKDYLAGDPKASIKYGKPYWPGYKYSWSDAAKKYISTYRDVDGSVLAPEDGGDSKHPVKEIGEGGYVYAKHGMYMKEYPDRPAAQTEDVASMHPTSAIVEGYLGVEGTKIYAAMRQLRVFIKHKDFDSAGKMFNGALADYLNDPAQAKAMSAALKIVLNSLYGLSSAKFENAFRHPDNKDNLIAKRGALTMIDIRNAVQEKGFTVVHCKTDSIKIANPTPEILKFVVDMGKAYGYDFEVEAIFDRICLINDAVYVAKLADNDPEHPGKWTATGKQFAVPYVFKTLFSKEAVEFNDMCETFAVKEGALYLDMNESLPDVSDLEKMRKKKDLMPDDLVYLNEQIEKGHDYQFVGRVGQFTPMLPGSGGGLLLAKRGDLYSYAQGSKGFRWMESETVRRLNLEDKVDTSYYETLAQKAVNTINQFGSYEEFVGYQDNTEPVPNFMNIPENSPEEIPFENINT